MIGVGHMSARYRVCGQLHDRLSHRGCQHGRSLGEELPGVSLSVHVSTPPTVLVDVPLEAVKQLVLKGAHDPIGQRIVAGVLPTFDVDRDLGVRPGWGPAVEPRPSGCERNAQPFRVFSFSCSFSWTVAGPRVVPGEPPVVGLDAECVNHLRDQFGVDVGRDVLPGQPGGGVVDAFLEGEHVAVVYDQLVRGRAIRFLLHIGQPRDRLALHEEGVVPAECVSGTGDRVVHVGHRDVISIVVRGRSDGPSIRCHRFGEFVRKDRRDARLGEARRVRNPL